MFKFHRVLLLSFFFNLKTYFKYVIENNFLWLVFVLLKGTIK